MFVLTLLREIIKLDIEPVAILPEKLKENNY